MNKAKEMSGFSAEIVADSLNEHGNRLTTFVVVFPRMVLAEFNTHRMLSRNSASSRAIPFKTMLKRVQEHPFIPMKWMKDHKGMQGNEYFETIADTLDLQDTWLEGRDEAMELAKHLNRLGLTKQICNRLLEPFMWHKVIVTATEWENFFALRAEDGAEIHIQHLAYMMLDAYNTSIPKILKAGEWHIPFGDRFDRERLGQLVNQEDREIVASELEQIHMVKIATARCARVSYINYEGKDDYLADIKLHNGLSKVGHRSPFEHCGKAMWKAEWDVDHWSGNFKGFYQYRKMFQEENRTDRRVIKQWGG